MRRTYVAGAALAAVLAGCGTTAPPEPRAAAAEAPARINIPGGGGNPLAWQVLYVNPKGAALTQVAAARKRGRTSLVKALRPIAQQPTATWFGSGTDVYRAALNLTTAAAKVKRLPLIVAYNLPERDCGQFSAGGAANIDEYLTWVGSLAAGVGMRPAAVVLEPDAIPHALEGCAGSRSAADRYALLREAVKILKRQPNVAVYVDAGNASWIKDLPSLAGALRASGVAKADGFALNISNFETTAASIKYGTRLSPLVGGKHFVVDTSRNGAGPPADGGADHSAWCNPEGMRLGAPPTTAAEAKLVDALLWVKQPGDSDGQCGPGDLPAGKWDPRHAGDLLGVRLPR